MKNKLLVLAAASAALVATVLTGCASVEPYPSKVYQPNAQIQRQLKRLSVEDIAVEQVRVVKPFDNECGGGNIPIPSETRVKDSAEAFANYWKNALMMDLRESGLLNQEKPKVKIYNLIDSVKIQAEPTALAYRIRMTLFSSNGGIMSEEVVYNAPTDGLKNIRQGCMRLADTLDKAVAWSILKTVSDPRFEQMVQPGLGFVPSMKGESIRQTLDVFGITKDEEDEYWKAKPTGGRMEGY